MRTLFLSLLITLLPASVALKSTSASAQMQVSQMTLSEIVTGIQSTVTRLEGYATIDEIKVYLLPIKKQCKYLQSYLKTRSSASQTLAKELDKLLTRLDSARAYFDATYEKEALGDLLNSIDTYTQYLLLARA